MANWALLQEQQTDLPVAKRAKHSVHFQRGPGEFLAQFSGKPCHYEDAGQWKPIDTKLIIMPDGWLGSPHSDVRIHPDGRVKVGSYQQRAELLSASAGLKDDNRIVRKFAFGEQSLYMMEDGFKSEVTLERVPTLAEVKKLLAVESGRIPKKYKKSPTVAADANLAEHVVDKLSDFRIWLEGAKYPVVIDPDFLGETADRYGYGFSKDYATAWSVCNTLSTITGTQLISGVAISSGNFVPYRSFWKFATGSIGSGMVVNQVNFVGRVSLKTVVSTNFDVQIVKADWSPYENFSTQDEKNSAYNLCMTADLDDNIFKNTSAIFINNIYTSGNLSPAWVNMLGYTYYATVSSLDRSYIQQTDNSYIAIQSANHATPAYRPYLTVLYSVAPSGIFIPVNMNSQMQNLSGGMRG